MKRSLTMAERKLARAQDYKRVFSTEQGKRVMHDMIRAHYIMGPTMMHGDETGIKLAYNEGQRNVVLRLLQIVNLSEADMKQLMGELNARE